MKNLIRWIIIGALTLLMGVLIVLGPSARAVPAIAAFELSQPSAAPNEQTLPSLTPAAGAVTPGANSGIIPQTGSNLPTPSGASMVQIRDQVCVRKLPYTILAMPSSATFEAVQPAGYIARADPATQNPNQFVCRSVLTLGNTQTVVCTGPQGNYVTLHVTNGATVEDLSIPLKTCVQADNTDSGQNPVSQPTAGPSSTPMPQPTGTEPPPQPTDSPIPLPTLPIGTP